MKPFYKIDFNNDRKDEYISKEKRLQPYICRHIPVYRQGHRRTGILHENGGGGLGPPGPDLV